ncbi:MAG: hemin-degrading factor [Candidatus Hydrogenedentota bacterium]
MTPESATLDRVEELKARWTAYRDSQKRANMYDAAEQFGVSEAELLATGTGDTVTRLRPEWGEILGGLEACGHVMTLTRNRYAVHEKHGVYAPYTHGAHASLVVSEAIDLRIFTTKWLYGFAVNNPLGKAYKLSFQFFDAQGDSVHKVFVPDSAAEAFEALRNQFLHDDQSPALSGVQRPAAFQVPQENADAAALREAWGAMKDTHDFFGMLKKVKYDRLPALKHVGAVFAERLSTTAYRDAMESASASGMPIMIFVGNTGCIQIHTGPVKRLVAMDEWYNVLDEDFNLHLRTGGVAETWLVRKPTTDGMVTSVELYDADGKEIGLIFGKRKPGIPELSEWRQLAESLPRWAGN